MKVIIGIVPACKRNDENPYEYRYSFINNYSKKILKNNQHIASLKFDKKSSTYN